MSNINSDYDVESIEVDERFKIAKKEMLITFGVQLAYTIIMILVAYTVGRGDPNDYKFIMGMPAWWFYCLLITIGFIGVIFFLTHYVYTNVSVEAYVDNDGRVD